MLCMRVLLTTDDVSHAAGGINTTDVFRMGGVGIIAKQECCWKTDKSNGWLERGGITHKFVICVGFFDDSLCWLMSMRKEMRLV